MSTKFNEAKKPVARASRELSTYEKAQRTLMTAMLGEDTFYEGGSSILSRLGSYVPNLTKDECKRLLVQSKDIAKLRHAPAYLAVKMLKNGYAEPEDFEKVSDRPDLMADIIGMYWQDKSNKKSIPRVMQKGLQSSFKKFDEYQLGKYKMEGKDISLRDVIRLLHTVPENDEQSALWKRAVDGELATPDTWEVALSSGKDKCTEWTRLLQEKTENGGNKLGSLALIRNIRNMESVNVNKELIVETLKNASFKRILPFQIVSAYRNTSSSKIKKVLEDKLFESFSSYDKLPGVTLMMVDVSGSMYSKMSRNSDLELVDAAATLASLIKEICEKPLIFAFDTRCYAMKTSKGMGLIDDIVNVRGGATAVVDCTNQCIDAVKSATGETPDRVIVITDEQDNGSQRNRMKHLGAGQNGYLINVAPYGNSEVRFGEHWHSISGWSDNIPKFIAAYEKFMQGE